MLNLDTDVRQTMSFISLVFTLISGNYCEIRNNNISTSIKPSLFQNGRHHELPTVKVESKSIVAKNSTAWILNIPQNIIAGDSNDLVVLTVTSTFPFTVFIEPPSTDDQWNGFLWDSLRNVNGDDIFNTSSFRFEMIWDIPWSFLKAKNSSFECRSIVPPFFGISVEYSLNSQNNVATFKTSESISDHFKGMDIDYFRLVEQESEKESCLAYFFWEQIIRTGSRFNGYSCLFGDGKPGFASSWVYYVDRILTNHVINGKNCWMRKEDCNKNISCDLQQLRKSPLYFSQSGYIICEPEATDENNLSDVNSTPVIVGLFDPQQNQLPEIFITEEEVKASSMIRMEPFEDVQKLGAKIVVTCTTVWTYTAYPVRFGVKRKNNSRITFFPATVDNIKNNVTYYLQSSSYNIPLDSEDIESIVCFAPVRGSYNWINTSRAVSVHEFSPPKFETDFEYSAVSSVDENIISVERTFMLGSKNEFLLCDVTGYPLPRISWTRNSVPLEPTQEEILQSLIRRSVIVFPQTDKTTEGVYTCRAQNSQGEAQLLYNVVITDDSAKILAASIATPVIGILFLSACLFVLLWKRIKRRHSRPLTFCTDEEVQEFVNGSQKGSDRVPNASVMQQAFDPKYILPRSSLKFDNNKLLGSGHFGVVMKGWLCLDGSTQFQVAIKSTKQNMDVLHFKAFLSEVKISSFLNGHPNIVEFFGAWIENTKNGEIYAAYELCKHGDLLTVLWRRKTQLRNSDIEDIDDALRLKTYNADERKRFIQNLFEWSRDIAKGMGFLRSKNIIHGDLAARNVLLTKSNVAKISDFGLSRQLINDYSIYVKKTKLPLPFKWLAPESLKNSNFSIQSDVWSFGITLWEIFSLGDPPFPGRRHNAEFVKDICEGMRPPKPQHAPDWMYNIMIRCWDNDPECRPNIASIAFEIQEFIDNDQSKPETKYTVL